MPEDLTPDRRRARVAEICEELAEATGDDRFARAAGALRGKPAGRPATNDGPALAYARSMLAAGLARSKNRACAKAAAIYARRTVDIDSTRARLMKKLKGN